STYGTKPVDCTALRPHQNPGFRTRTTRVVARGVAPDLPEDLLQHILRSRGVPDYPLDETERGAAQEIVEATERLPIPSGDACNQRDSILVSVVRRRHGHVISTRAPMDGQHMR